MTGTQLVYTNPPPQTIEVNAGWQDTVTTGVITAASMICAVSGITHF